MNFIHVMTACVWVGSFFFFCFALFPYLRRRLDSETLQVWLKDLTSYLHFFLWLCLGGIVISGLHLFFVGHPDVILSAKTVILSAEHEGSLPLFWIKMGITGLLFVLLLIITMGYTKIFASGPLMSKWRWKSYTWIYGLILILSTMAFGIGYYLARV